MKFGFKAFRNITRIRFLCRESLLIVESPVMVGLNIDLRRILLFNRIFQQKKRNRASSLTLVILVSTRWRAGRRGKDMSTGLRWILHLVPLLACGALRRGVGDPAQSLFAWLMRLLVLRWLRAMMRSLAGQSLRFPYVLSWWRGLVAHEDVGHS